MEDEKKGNDPWKAVRKRRVEIGKAMLRAASKSATEGDVAGARKLLADADEQFKLALPEGKRDDSAGVHPDRN